MVLAVNFYQQMGFVLIVSTTDYSRFECPEGESTFSLSLDAVTPVHGAVIYFEHEALDQWVTELKNKGLKFDQDPADQSYLWREAILHDPSGNKIKLYWAGENRKNPPWRVES